MADIYCRDFIDDEKIKYILKHTTKTTTSCCVIEYDIKIPAIFNTLKYPPSKLSLLKHYFANDGVKIIINVDCDEFICQLLEQTIITNKIEQARYLLKNKKINISTQDYQKLIDKATQLHLFDFNSAFIEYMMIDQLALN